MTQRPTKTSLWAASMIFGSWLPVPAWGQRKRAIVRQAASYNQGVRGRRWRVTCTGHNGINHSWKQVQGRER